MDFINKIGEFLDALNGSKVWEYLKSILGKITELLDFYGEDEAKKIFEIIPHE